MSASWDLVVKSDGRKNKAATRGRAVKRVVHSLMELSSFSRRLEMMASCCSSSSSSSGLRASESESSVGYLKVLRRRVAMVSGE